MTNNQYEKLLEYLKSTPKLKTSNPIEILNDWASIGSVEFSDVPELLHIINVIQEHPSILKGDK